MSVRCKIECIRRFCPNAEPWGDPGGLDQRTLPTGWVLAPDEGGIYGLANERAKGICPECRNFTLTLTGDDPPSLWGRSFDVKAVEPGMFDVVQEDGSRYGQVRWASRHAMLTPGRDAHMDHLAVIAGRIAERFALA